MALRWLIKPGDSVETYLMSRTCVPTLTKADPALRDALSHADNGETVTAIMTLSPIPDLGRIRGGYPPGRHTRLSRQELIEQRKAQIAQGLGPILQGLADLDLRISGAQMSNTAVVSGPAPRIAQALELEGVESAMLDRPLDLIEPKDPNY